MKFNFRVALLAVHDDKILLQKSDKDSFYSLIGGRVKLNENTKEALIRETEEETGIIIKSSEMTLIKVVENFFTYNEKRFHELLYIYKVNNNELNNSDEFNTLDKQGVINKWFNINEIDSMDIKPEIIKNCYLDNSISHEIINC